MLTVIKNNFNNVTQYQSIYDMHELLISLLIKTIKERDLKVQPDFVTKKLDQEAVPIEGEEFKAIS